MKFPHPHRIELPTIYGMKTVNAYLFTDPEPVLIDCGEGSEQSFQVLTQELQRHGLKMSDLSTVIITHAHVDHMGCLSTVAAHSDAEIWVSDLVYEWAVNVEEVRRIRVEAIDRVILDFHSDPDSPLRQMLMSVYHGFGNNWGSVSADRVRTFGITDPLEFGGRRWETLYTPGHSNTQSCFYHAESRELISSDMLLSITPSPVIEANPDPPYERIPALPQMLDSYQQINQLAIDQVYPGHYEPFTEAHEMIQKQVARIHFRKEQCLGLIKAGHADFMSLLQQMYGKRMSLPAVPMMVGYLDLLLAEGKIDSRRTPEGLRFS
ncbi:MAG: MBL fold metallo-hydrolase [Bacteroidota bacterium]